jgi:hypothetical protein
VLPEEFDELSPKEELYYQKPPFSTNEVFLGSKGGVSQLVDHGPEGVRQGYADNLTPIQILDKKRITNPDPKAYQEMEKIIEDLLVESDIKGTKVKHLPQDITIQQLRNKVTATGYKRSSVSNELFKKILNEKKGITYDNYRARKIATVLNEALEKSGGNILSIKPSVAVQLLPEFKVKGVQTKGGQGGNILKTYKNYLQGSARLANRAGIPIPETFGDKSIDTILKELETNYLDILGGRARGSFDVLNEVKLLDRIANENPKVSAFKLKELYEQAGGTQFKLRLKSLYPSKAGSLGRTQDKLILEAVKEGSISNSMPHSIREAYRVFAKEINMSRFMAQAEKYRKSNPELAYRYTQAFNMVQDKNMKRLGITGAGEHALPISAINTANAAEDTYFKIDGYIDHELNSWKRVHFDEPIFRKGGLADKYHKATNPKVKAEIQEEIIQRLDFMKKRAPELMGNVTFDFTGGKFTANSSTIPIDQLDDAGFKNLFTKGNRINQKFITDMPDAVKLTSTGRIASIKDKFIKPTVKGTYQPTLYSGAAVFDEFLKSGAAKKVGSGLRKVGAEFEAAFIVFDFMNNLSKGIEPGEALQKSLQVASLGIYKGGDRATIENILKEAKEAGFDPKVLRSLINVNKSQNKINDFNKKINNNLKTIEDLKERDVSNPSIQKQIKAFEDLNRRLKSNLDKEIEIGTNLFGTYATDVKKSKGLTNLTNEDVDRSFIELQTAGINLLQKKQIKSAKQKSTQVDVEAGKYGDIIQNAIGGLWTYPKYAYDLLNPLTPLPKWGGWKTEGMKEKDLIADMQKRGGPGELYRYNIARGFDIDQPVTAQAFQTMTEEQPYLGFGEFSKGGIASLTRTVAPDSGPVSRGLRSLYIDDMD